MKRRHRIAHRRIWFALGAILPAILIVALFGRQPRQIDNPVVRISAPIGEQAR
jgi:hypothetical protein